MVSSRPESVALVWPLEALEARWRENSRRRLGRWEVEGSLGWRKAIVPPWVTRVEEPHMFVVVVVMCCVWCSVGSGCG